MSKEFFSWRQRYFDQLNEYSWRPKNKAVEKKIRDELAKFAVAISLDEAVEGIPAPIYHDAPFAWDDEHFHRISRFAITKSIKLPSGKTRTAQSEGGYLSMLRQLTSGLLYAESGSECEYLSTSRIQAVEELVDASQGPVLVAAYFKAEIDAMMRRFRGAATAFVGSTTAAERSRIITRWNDDQIPILIASPGAMGHGINLQHGSCRTLVWATHSFDWAQRAQFNARLVRSGQTKTISIINLVADAGIDRAVLNALDNKQAGDQAMLAALDIRHRFNGKEVNHV
jgi:hypothetical protein